jgi:hypothetical protein
MLNRLLSAAVTHRRRGTARELFCQLRELLRQAVVPVAVVQMKLNKVAIFIHPNRRDIVDTDSASAYVAKFNSFDAHCDLRSALPYIP